MNKCCPLLLALWFAACSHSASSNSASTSNSGTTGGSNGSSTGTTNPNNSAASSVGMPGTLTGPQIRYIGRIDPNAEGGVAMSWSGTGFEITVSGAHIVSMLLQPQQHMQPNVVNVYLDGVFNQNFTTSNDANLVAVAMPDSNTHVVRVIKTSEGGNGTVVVGQIMTDGVLQNAPSGPGRLIEFVGDTLMTGYAVLAPAGQTSCTLPPNCVADPSLQQVELAYPYLTAQNTNADASIIAFTSRGLLYNLDGTQASTLPLIYQLVNPWHITPTWTFAPQPNAIVVNLGTQDVDYWLSNPNATNWAGFTAAYLQFVQQIRKLNPQSYIVLTVGSQLSNYVCINGNLVNGSCQQAGGGSSPPVLTMMENAVQSVVSSMNNAGDSKVSYFEFAADSADVTCNYAPDQAGHRTMATALTAYLNSIPVW